MGRWYNEGGTMKGSRGLGQYNDAQPTSAREGDQPRIRTGRGMMTARVRTGASRNQESAVRPGDLPRIRTGTCKAGIG